MCRCQRNQDKGSPGNHGLSFNSHAQDKAELNEKFYIYTVTSNDMREKEITLDYGERNKGCSTNLSYCLHGAENTV